jgi:hypothetical protein
MGYPRGQDIARFVERASVRLAQAASAGMLLFAVGYAAWYLAHASAPFLDAHDAVLFFAPPFATFALSTVLSRYLSRTSLSARTAALLLLAALATVAISAAWFDGPMHDIGLLFGSHGRWGDILVNDDLSPVYFFRDSTVPWMLFGPAVLAVGARVIRRLLPDARS